jgi:hypothetical protein
MANRYFYDPATGSWGSADDLEIIELDDALLDADEVEEALCEASQKGAGASLEYVLDTAFIVACKAAQEGLYNDTAVVGLMKATERS